MKSALIIIDVQNDFIKDTSPYSCQMLDNNLIDNIYRLITFARNIGLPTIYTQHSINPDKSNAELGEPENVRSCITGTHGWEIIYKLKPEKNDIIIKKEQYDAFYDTELEYILKSLDVESLYICGVLTNNCIRATVEGAHYRRFKVRIVTDCCGGTSYIPDITHEKIHDITLRDLECRVYEVKLVKLSDIYHINWD